jgi:two-component system response regulator MtrA
MGIPDASTSAPTIDGALVRDRPAGPVLIKPVVGASGVAPSVGQQTPARPARTGRAGRAGRVLLVDDDAALAEMLSLVLRNEGFDPIWCAHGDSALDTYRYSRPDLVLLDLMLPGKDGMAICRQIRSESVVPIVMLTARSDTTDVVEGLDAGADDYLAKPFKAKELIARIKTRLRHSPVVNHDMVRIGDLVIDIAGHTVRRNDNLTVSLTRIEFDLLLALARRPQQVFSRTMLLEQVWHFRYPGDTRLVNVHIQRLRSKIERDPTHPEIVVTVRGIGYKAGEPTTAG